MNIEDRIGKLPQWARDHISDLERKYLESQDIVRKLEGDQKVTNVFTDEIHCDGPKTRISRRYFEARTLEIHHGGVQLSVSMTNVKYVRFDADGEWRIARSDDPTGQWRNAHHAQLLTALYAALLHLEYREWENRSKEPR